MIYLNSIELESDGIAITKPVTETVKAGLLFIVGDNLGQGSI